jgi:uncharacterized C2H2 Zn-finger protein
MTKDDIKNQQEIIRCPRCNVSVTVDALGEHVNSNPQIKEQAIAEQLEQWGEAYDLEYLTLNLVFCPRCHKVSHFKDWSTDIKK